MIENEEPLVVLKPKSLHYWALFFLVILTTIFFIAGTIIPVLMTGDYAAIWPASDKRIGRKICFFYMAWGWIISIPYFIPIFNRRKICFYNDRLEIYPYLFNKKIIINYNNMRVNVHGNYRITITKIYKFNINKPLQYINDKFVESITFSQLKSNAYDYNLINKAIGIIKERAHEYNIKPTS